MDAEELKEAAGAAATERARQQYQDDQVASITGDVAQLQCMDLAEEYAEEWLKWQGIPMVQLLRDKQSPLWGVRGRYINTFRRVYGELVQQH